MISKNLKKVAFVLWAAMCALSLAAQCQGSTIAQWTFESTLPATAGPFSPEVGAGSATGSHASGAAAYSSPAGNGSPHSFSSNNWGLGDYYQFSVSTTGLQNIQVSWDQTSSATGPGTYAFQYSTNGTTFTTLGGNYTVVPNASPNPFWNSTTPSSLYSFSRDLSSIVSVSNAANIYFRLTQTGTTTASGGSIGTGGTDRVDNFTVLGTPVPEPSTCVLAGIAVVGLVGLRARRSFFGGSTNV